MITSPLQSVFNVAICWNIRVWSGTLLTIIVISVTIRLLRTISRKSFPLLCMKPAQFPCEDLHESAQLLHGQITEKIRVFIPQDQQKDIREKADALLRTKDVVGLSVLQQDISTLCAG